MWARGVRSQLIMIWRSGGADFHTGRINKGRASRGVGCGDRPSPAFPRNGHARRCDGVAVVFV